MKDTREHILKVSLKLFMQKSFKEVTMKEIVDKTGMSKGAVYHYFESKEQLFQELINNVFSKEINEYYDYINADSLYQFYHNYIEHFVRGLFPENMSDEEGCSSLNYFTLVFDSIKLFPDFQQKLLESQKIELDAWESIILLAKNKGEIRTLMDDEQIAKMFICSSDGLGMRNIMTKASYEDTKKSLTTLWDDFYKALKA